VVVIRAEALVVDRGGRRLLDGAGVTVRPGRVTAVLGPNGAGKSTLLRALAGDLALAAGEVWIDGRGLADWPRRDLARRRAVLLQESTLALPYGVFEVVLMGRAPHVGGGETAADHAIALAALGRVGAASLAARSYPTLSGGEKQRVQLARALAQVAAAPAAPGGYLLLDEPTASLDPRHQHLVLGLARSVAAEGGGVLVILHDVNLASQYADEAALLACGRVVACGEVEEVMRAEHLRAAFDLDLRAIRIPGLVRPYFVAGLEPAPGDAAPPMK
jgi:iron complex transport system ATP-binding protein